MNKISENEWAILEVLWEYNSLSLGEIVEQLEPILGWSKNTVFTYLTRMEKKNLINIDRTCPKPYSATFTKEECERNKRNELLNQIYKGSTSDLLVAFLKESKINEKERDRLKKMLDDMEV